MPEVDGDGRGVGLVPAGLYHPDGKDRRERYGEDELLMFHGILLNSKIDEYTKSSGRKQISIRRCP
jgi:hypothetical protein